MLAVVMNGSVFRSPKVYSQSTLSSSYLFLPKYQEAFNTPVIRH